MRFNAFNFAGMKKSTIWVLGIVMGLSFLSLLYLQVSYIEEMVKMRKANGYGIIHIAVCFVVI